jgi:hypothetical protein
MTKVVVGMSMSLDGIAGPEVPEAAGRDWRSFEVDADGMAVFSAVLGWVFPLRSWREQQGQEGGEDVLLAGGVSVAQQALAAGLVDRSCCTSRRCCSAAASPVRHRPGEPALRRDYSGRGSGPPAL